jgi:hypothetical protein
MMTNGSVHDWEPLETICCCVDLDDVPTAGLIVDE